MSHLCLSIHCDTSASRWLDLCQLILTANRDFDLFPINLALISKSNASEAQPCPKVSTDHLSLFLAHSILAV